MNMKRLTYFLCTLLALLFATNNLFAQDDTQPKKLRKIYLWDVTASMDKGGFYKGTVDWLIRDIEEETLDDTEVIILPFNDRVIEDIKIEFVKGDNLDMYNIAKTLCNAVPVDGDYDNSRYGSDGLRMLGGRLVSNHDRNFNELSVNISKRTPSKVMGFTNVVAAIRYATALRNENADKYNTDVIILTDGNHEYYSENINYLRAYKLDFIYVNGKKKYLINSDTDTKIAVNGGDDTTRQLLQNAILDGWCKDVEGTGDKLWYVITNRSIKDPFDPNVDISTNVEVISGDEFTAKHIGLRLKNDKAEIGFNDHNIRIGFYCDSSFSYSENDVIKIQVKGKSKFIDINRVYQLDIKNMCINIELDEYIIDKVKMGSAGATEDEVILSFDIDNKEDILKQTNTNLSMNVNDEFELKIVNKFMPRVTISVK